MGDLLDATEASIGAAVRDHTLDLTISAGPVEALRILAQKIDADETLREAALKWAAEDEARKPPPIDNVSIPTYLKFCTELKLTPASRVDLKKEPEGGKLAQLRSIRAGEAARG